ncbi:uncharacterized protein LOC117587117 isoform X1 [Drosophila guanche]|uniref:TATA box-binding protein-like 1 n=1 Tax=Drosophila guanche TaxID=7266 RepID=A0A3B0JWT7_DROGU|nr:uncharacterized protein LOC117587117 isoform X1 [Drosophila guanche]SPP84892.1 blast:TATA box-binding protein-like protein 1 [Drosophila guanche]
MSGARTYSKRDPGGDEDGGKEASAESAESLEHLTIPELLDGWAIKKSEKQGAHILRLLELRTKEEEQKDAQRALQQQKNLQQLANCRQKARAQEQARLRDEKLHWSTQEAESKEAKRSAALRKDIEHQILVQQESEAKRIREEAVWGRTYEQQKKNRKSNNKSEQELVQQRERFSLHETLHTEAQQQDKMVNIPMANLKPILKQAPGSATGGGVRYFSQFSKGGGSTATTSTNTSSTTLVHQQLQRKPTANGDLHGTNGRVAVVANGMRTKAEQQDMQQEVKQEAITKTEADNQPAEDASVADGPLALLSNQQPTESDDPELDIVINNVVCTFSVRCHLKLRDIALRGSNVEYRRENGMVTMKLRRPYTTASIWSSGRITCTGATSEEMAKVAARRYARYLGKLDFPTRFQNFRVVNVLGTCSMPWAIKIVNFSTKYPKNASYEPELHPGVTYKMHMPKATLKIFSTGSITVTAASVNDVEAAIQQIYPLVHEFRKQRSPEELQHLRAKQNKNAGITGNTSNTITDANEALALEEQILTIPSSAAGDLVNAAVCNVQRLKQIESFRQMSSETEEERRHIPFPRDKTEEVLFTHSSASGSSTDNICANARRRATECWATKNKRTRYNDPSGGTIVAAGKTNTTTMSARTTASSSNPAIANQSTSTSTSATTITGPILPLSSLTPIGSISGGVNGRPFSLVAARTIPATGTIINLKQSCIKPLNRDALAAFTAASSGSIATAVNSTATAKAVPGPSALKRQSRGGGHN